MQVPVRGAAKDAGGQVHPEDVRGAQGAGAGRPELEGDLITTTELKLAIMCHVWDLSRDRGNSIWVQCQGKEVHTGAG